MKTKLFRYQLILAMLFIGLFFTACQEGNEVISDVPEVNQAQQTEEVGEFSFDLPAEFANKSEEERTAYVLSISGEQMEKMHETTKLTAFLKENDLYERTISNLDGQELSEVDPSTILTKAQMGIFETYSISNTGSRGCTVLYKYSWNIPCNGTWEYRCGDVYECKGGSYVLIAPNFCQKSYMYKCSGANITDDYYTNNLDNICNGRTAQPFDGETMLAMATFVSEDLGVGGQEIVSLYISNQGEINEAFTSDDPKYDKLQEALQDFLIENDDLLKNGFTASTSMTLQAHNIQSSTKLLDELSMALDNQELQVEIGKISKEVNKLQGKQLKDALIGVGLSD